MAYEADRVVVSLVADNTNFDSTVRQSTTAYQQSMGAIESAAGGAEKAHGRLTLAANNNRIAMLEMQHVVRGSVDQFAAGAPVTTIFAQHIASIGEAAALSGATLGKVGAFLAGPWGLALTAATALIVTLISKHKEESDTLDSLLKKKQEHAEKTKLNAEVDDIWKHSIDGVIESEKALADQLEKTNTIQSVANQNAFASAQNLVALRAQQLAAAEQQFNEGDPRLTKATEAFHQAVRELNELQTIVSEKQGEALADLSTHADLWADKQEQIIRNIQRLHPELAASGTELSAAFDRLKTSVGTAASAGISVDPVTHQIDALNNKLAQSPEFIGEYINDLKKLAAQIDAFTNTAKNAPKAIDDFKRSVIGAEGTGPNRLGSSAAGFGQFMPSTFEGYFKQLYPQQASGMSNAQIDEMRNNRQVAEAVIDAATKDYVTVLKSAGQQITAAALYTVHLLGAGDARKLFAASPGTSTSSFLSAGVLRGNPFLQGTAGDARSAIASRIGDSSSAVTAGATALQRVLDEQLATMARINTRAQDEWHAEQKVTVEKGQQVNYVELYNLQNKQTLLQLAEGLVDMTKWNRQYEELINSQKELNDFGGQMLDTIFNPDNWSSWGNLGKTILHELEMEFIKLAALNPLKNLLTGSNLPTLGGVFTSLFGGGGIASAGIGGASVSGLSAAPVPSLPGGFFAAGGSVSANRPIVVGEKGPEVFVPSTSGKIVPNNGKAATPYGNAGQGFVLVQIEAGEYFDGRVMKVTGPVIAQAAVRSATGGATLSRHNLGREQMHQLD